LLRQVWRVYVPGTGHQVDKGDELAAAVAAAAKAAAKHKQELDRRADQIPGAARRCCGQAGLRGPPPPQLWCPESHFLACPAVDC